MAQLPVWVRASAADGAFPLHVVTYIATGFAQLTGSTVNRPTFCRHVLAISYGLGGESEHESEHPWTQSKRPADR